MKICTKCKVKKDESEFYFKNVSKGTRRSSCTACDSAYAKKHDKRTEIMHMSKYKEKKGAIEVRPYTKFEQDAIDKFLKNK